jgi:hypothetical protein
MKTAPMKKLHVRSLLNRYTRTIRRDSYISWPMSGAVACSIAGVVLYIVYRDTLPSVVPLYYSLPWGEERLANTEYLLILPISILLVILVNGVIGLWTFGREVVLSRMVMLGTLLFAVLALITMIRIMWLII